MNTPESHWQYTLNEWSHPPFTSLLDAIPAPRVIYDVGANVGGWAHIAKQRWPLAYIHCFEPVQSNFVALVQNVSDVETHDWGIYYGATKSRVGSRGPNGNPPCFPPLP